MSRTSADQDENGVVADAIVKEDSAMNTLMNTLAPIRSSQEITHSRRIGFLVFPDCEILDVCGPFDAFYYADYWLARFGRTNEAGYQCDILAATPGPIRTMCGIEIVAKHNYCDIRDGLDTLVVAGGLGVEQACKDPSLVEWVHSMAPRVRRVASICSGAFILAAEGLLNNRRVTTHWLFSELLAAAYPSIHVDSNLIFRRREAQHSSALSLLDFPFLGAAFASSKCSGRRRGGRENPIFPW